MAGLDTGTQEQARTDLQRLEALTRVMVRPLGGPLPLGFLALAAATLLVSGLQLSWLRADQGRVIALALMGFVFPLQLLASILGYLSRDVVAGTGMGILAGTWLVVGLVQYSSPSGTTSDGLGLLLLMAGAAMIVPALGAALGKLVPAMVLGTTSVRFAASGVYEMTSQHAWEVAAGWIGILLLVIAIYAASALLLEEVHGTAVLPTLRRANGTMATGGTLRDQVIDIHHEPGVRRQL